MNTIPPGTKRHPLAARVTPSLVLPACDRAVNERLGELSAVTRTFMKEWPCVRPLLAGIAAHSPFLWRLASQDPDRLQRILSCDPDDDLADVLQNARRLCACAITDGDVRRILRQTRAHVALLVALADLGHVWLLPRVTEALTDAADTFVRCALDHCLRAEKTAGRLVDDGSSGLIVLGLGKLGAGELNYSSDIDIVVFFDAHGSALSEGIEPGPFFVRLTQRFAKLLSERTEDGYVARVDLRLRPDPGSTAVALPVSAALSYYETLGQNWERAAFIKARPIAGDVTSGAAFLAELEPFIWRRYFDYAAIADIHAMKRQIHAVRGFAEIAVAGHDVKLGRGGIREIEFFVQTQQLIFGGRRPEMRGRRTVEMLEKLAAAGWVTSDARTELTDAYTALRTVEHRLQMINDEQTQRLPQAPENLLDFAQLCGFDTAERFESWITSHFRAVEKHYALLFEHAPGLDASVGDLVFTGSQDDPATIQTLTALGYKQPALVTEIVRGWHFGHRPAIRSARAREVLTELVPALLQSFAKSGDPDLAVATFDAALARMPAATELFSVLRSSAQLRILFGDILGAAPRLTDIVTATPHVLDAVIDPRSFRRRYDDLAFADDVAALAVIDDTEEFLDRCRLIARESQFAIGISVLSRTIEPQHAGDAYSSLAAALARAALAHVHRAISRDHGIVASMEIAIVALGKLGSREMTAASDLDLMVVYRADADAMSDGKRPLTASQYAARLTQRLIAALTAPTREGRLYDIDVRLRPWGTQGPLAVGLDALTAYHANDAETWERMALCRARPIAGSSQFMAIVADAIKSILSQAPKATLASDVWDMRNTIAQTKGDTDFSDLKTLAGGLLDIEFLAQFIVLRYGCDHPALLRTATRGVLDTALAEDVLDAETATFLIGAHDLYTGVVQMQRLTLRSGIPSSQASKTAQRLIATCVGFPDAGALSDALKQQARGVREIFRRLLTSTAQGV